MRTLIIEPHDSFIARDGRPFDPVPGARSQSLPFPFPSTTTGGVRTRAGLDADGVFDTAKANIERVKTLSVRGPLLVELDRRGGVRRWLAHAPADALLLETEDRDPLKASARRLLTQQPPAGALTEMPGGLLPLYLPKDVRGRYDKRKPHGSAPRFWYWESLEAWLRGEGLAEVVLSELGHAGPPQDERTHVNIRPETQTHEEGQLFQTRGREFTRLALRIEDGTAQLDTAARLALAVATDADGIHEGVAPLGGERRLVTWRKFRAVAQGAEDKTGAFDLLSSECPAMEIADRIVADGACRVLLLTPAHFDAGWRPSWLIEGCAGVKEVEGGAQAGELTVELKAAAVGRAQVVSGWDFEYPQGPKPTRRLVSAGSVFFVRLRGEEAAIRSWIKAVWMRCVSDGGQDRGDGFGLAALGVWPEGRGLD